MKLVIHVPCRLWVNSQISLWPSSSSHKSFRYSLNFDPLLFTRMSTRKFSTFWPNIVADCVFVSKVFSSWIRRSQLYVTRNNLKFFVWATWKIANWDFVGSARSGERSVNTRDFLNGSWVAQKTFWVGSQGIEKLMKSKNNYKVGDFHKS